MFPVLLYHVASFLHPSYLWAYSAHKFTTLAVGNVLIYDSSQGII